MTCDLSGLQLGIFAETGHHTESCDGQEGEACYLQPKLVQHLDKMLDRRNDCLQKGRHGPVSADLLAEDLGGNAAHLPCGRNGAHRSILAVFAGYNDATVWRCCIKRRKQMWGNSMPEPAPDFKQLKAGMKAAWMAGDFGQIAQVTANEAAQFVERLEVPSGARVLDVACGTGNTAIPAARAGGEVTGVDIATNLLEQASKRAAAEQLKVRFQEGDAEELPFPDHSFEMVITMFGAMFAPRPERVASELLRVCKPGGQIAMANWTPRGFVGESFRLMFRTVPPPPGIPAPILWGEEEVVRQRFGNGVAKLTLTPRKLQFRYPLAQKRSSSFSGSTLAPHKQHLRDWTKLDRRRWPPNSRPIIMLTIRPRMALQWWKRSTWKSGRGRHRAVSPQPSAVRKTESCRVS